MFDNDISYLGGMTTVLQDSMNGHQYGRELVNDGSIIPNDAISGRVHQTMPQMQPAHSSFQQGMGKGKMREVPADEDETTKAIKKQMLDFKMNSRPINFFGLQMPQSLVAKFPNVQTWISSLQAYEANTLRNQTTGQIIKGTPTSSLAVFALELVQPDTYKTDIPTRVSRAQQLRQHIQDNIKAASEQTNASNQSNDSNVSNQSNTSNQSNASNQNNTSNHIFEAIQDTNLQKPNESLSTQIMNFASSTSGKVVIGLTVVGALYYFSQRR